MSCIALPVNADYIVPAGATTSLGAGTLDLACTDLIVAGTLNVGSGTVSNARNVTVQAGGTVQGGAGAIALSGNWLVDPVGQFVPGTSSVRFEETCGPGASTVSGSSTFYDVHFVSTTGKAFVFAINSTQTIAHLFEFTGTPSAPSQFRSLTAGLVAFIDLQPGGTQVISHVGVTDVWATGQWLAPFQTNEGGGGNARRWFGNPALAEAIPTIANGALAALAILLAGIAALARSDRLRARNPGKRMTARSRNGGQ